MIDAVTLTPARAIEAESVRWGWQDRVPLGMLTLLVGPPGLGKSTLTLELAARVSRGQMAGHLAGGPAPVAVATAEDALAAVVRPRLDAAGADLDIVHLVAVRRDGETGLLALPEDLPALEAQCQAAGVRLLVIDPVVAHMPATADSYRDQHVRRVLAPLAGLAERCGLAAVGVMHLNKRSEGDPLTRVNGSIGFSASARSVLLVAPDPDDPDGPTRLVAHAKCNVGPIATTLRLRIEGREVVARDGTSIRTSGVAWCGEAPGVTAADLCQAPVAEEEKSALNEAIEAIEGIVAPGPIPVADARKALRAAGITDRTADRARGRLGVRARPTGYQGAWRWHPPASPQSRPVPGGGETDETGDDGETGAPETPENRQSRQDSPVSPSRQEVVRGENGNDAATCPVCRLDTRTRARDGEVWCVACCLITEWGARPREPGEDDDDPTPAWWGDA